MLTLEESAELTQVGRGTLVGELLRRYWFPVAASAQLEKEPVIPVELLGEKLVLFRDNSGKLGLLERACPHRRTSLAYGMAEDSGIRCAYHGWRFDAEGNCTEQPSEPEGSTYYQKITTPAYPVQELGGLIFGYLGPSPAPLLPRYNVLDWKKADRDINGTMVPCNWLQVVENILDPSHIENLHGRYFGYVLERTDPDEAKFFKARFKPAPIKHMSFDVFERGIIERHYTRDETDNTWTTGSPIFFPSTAMMGRPDRSAGALILIVPLDDERTWFIEHRAQPAQGKAQQSVPFIDVPGTDEDGEFRIATANGQDHMVSVTQGSMAARHLERLGATDTGLILYRQLLIDQARLAADGGDPMGVLRDPSQNKRIDMPVASPQHEQHEVEVAKA
ncbi:MAG: aromatic ring-hydroxylating dioxygenase subunit alpha [Dehalococcoidia bacterium]